MFFIGKNLIGLNVETENGQRLGKIANFELDINSHQIIKYYIKNYNPLGGLFKDELIIHNSQVAAIQKDKMIAKNLIIKEEEMLKEKSAIAAPKPI